MNSPAPRRDPSITHQQELEARIQALEAIVGALLRFAAGQQSLANALKEARQRGESAISDPANAMLAEYQEFYRDSFHSLAVSMIPLGDLETFRSNLQNLDAKRDPGSEESSRGH